MSQSAPITSAWAAMITATVLFAASYTLTKVALRDIPPFTLGLVRFALAAAVLIAVRRAGPRPTGAELRSIAWAATFGITAYFALENLGVEWATATDAALLVAAYPALAVALEAGITRTRPTTHTLTGLAITAAGVVLVVTASGTGAAHETPRRLLGDLLLIGSGLAWAAYTLTSQRLAHQRPVLQTVAWQDGIGALLFIPLAALEAPRWRAPLHPGATTASLTILVIGCSIAAMALYNHALTGLRPATAVNALNLVPIWGALIAATFLGEHLTHAHLIGAAIVLAGVAVTHREAHP